LTQYINIGYTRKAHGLEGELKCSIEERYEEDFLSNERIFIDVKGSKVPYFIANIRGKGEIILQLEEVNNRDQAILLQSKGIFLREQDLIPDDERELEVIEETLQYARVAGYLLKDQTLGDIAVINEVLDMPQQEMAFLSYQNREILIPLNEHLIVSIDDANKIVLMDLPEGLI
jgi:16S rRNA processing protein RimM